MDLVIAPSSLPIRWEGVDYKILEAGIRDGQPYANVAPSNASLERAIQQHIQNYQSIRVDWKSGYLELVDR